MFRYLIVTHRTALSTELRHKVGELVAEDATTEFAILVPEDPTPDYSWEGESVDAASQRAESARMCLEESLNAKVVRTAVGPADPMQAIADELHANPDYQRLLICTLPPGASRWLHLDLVHQAHRKFHLPVIHVVAYSSVA